MTYGHRTGYRADPLRDRIVPLPPDLDPLLGIYVAHMGPICANGLLHAAVEEVGRDVRALGDGVRGRRVAVVGGGVVGLLTGLFARHHGADEVVAARPDPAAPRGRRRPRTDRARPRPRRRRRRAQVPLAARRRRPRARTSSSSAAAAPPPWPWRCACSARRAP